MLGGENRDRLLSEIQRLFGRGEMKFTSVLNVNF